jgi:hypothetical protein
VHELGNTFRLLEKMLYDLGQFLLLLEKTLGKTIALERNSVRVGKVVVPLPEKKYCTSLEKMVH